MLQLSRFLAAVFLAFLSSIAGAKTIDPDRLDIWLFETPFNTYTGAPYPSMRQATSWTASAYNFLHTKLQEERSLFPAVNDENRIWLILATDILMDYAPFGSSWQHEEWHRAVMSHRNISSFNEVYHLRPFASTIKVSRVSDEDLSRFKSQHPAEFVRMSSAGIEAQTYLVHEFTKRNFLIRNRSNDRFVMLLNNLNSLFYFNTCASSDADKATDESNKIESTIADRDFTGLDCTAYTYDLHRPFEAYSDRGTHPTGVGIDRYIRWSDLNSQEQAYLKSQNYLSILNFFNPLLWTADVHIAEDPLNKMPFAWTWHLHHYLAPFGYQVGVNYLARQGVFNFILTANLNNNSARSFPGLGLQIERAPLRTTIPLAISSSFSYWQQPTDQMYFANSAESGLLASIKLHQIRKDDFEFFYEIHAKDPGWVPGYVELERAWGVGWGLTLLL